VAEPVHAVAETVVVAEVDRLAVAFARVLRGAGLDVPVGATITFAQGLAAVGLERPELVYWAGRATLVKRAEDIDTFDRAFGVFWLGETPPAGAPADPEPVTITLAFDDPDAPAAEDGADEEVADGPVLSVRWSPAEILRQRDFAAYTAAEFEEARRLMSDLRLAGALRRSRRLRPTFRDRGRPDVRRTVRQALRAGGEPVRRAYLGPATRPRRVVLLCDVSGSMEPYARALLRFLHAAVVGRGRVEAFAMGTRLTRITRELSSRDPDAALGAACGSSTTGGACGEWHAAPSSSSCPTAGIGATPRSSASRWRASRGSRSGSCG
jgi:uncharacterized protein with von Willebrand factor type A (vWA) domain